jgi:hemerythrin-like domain-containing protein
MIGNGVVMAKDLPRIMRQLMQDHRNMARLLDVLQEELERYRAGGSIDFEVVSRIVDYVLNFPELRHHPREDLVFRHLAGRDAASGRLVAAIIAEHGDLAALSRKLAAALRNLHQNAEMSRPWLESLLGSFITKYWEHMGREEDVYFPLAMRMLTASDWQRIEEEATEGGADPLFGGSIDADYQALHDRILSLAS